MTLRTRAWVTAAVLVVLAVAGEFVGAARRRILRREVPDAPPPQLQPGQILVRVKGPDGRPVPQASVALTSLTGPPGGRSGSRRIGGMTASYCVLGPRDAGGGETWLEVSGAADTADDPLPFGAVLLGPIPSDADHVDVVLPPERTLRGTIRRAGAPLQGVGVKARSAYPPEIEFLAGSASDNWHAARTTGADGAFVLGRLGGGPQEVVFDSPPGIAIAARRTDGGGTLDIDLDDTKAAAVTVLDGGGRPVFRAAVSVEEESEGAPRVRRIRARGVTNGDGRVLVHGLDPARTFRLMVNRPGANPAARGEESDWKPSEVTVQFPNQRSILIRAVDETGSPHAGVFVSAAPVAPGRPGATATTGKDGWCALHGLDAGPLKVMVTDSCSFHPAESVASRVVGEKEKEALFTIPRGAALSILRPDGTPWSGRVRAVLRQEGGNDAAATISRNGAIAWHGVDPAASYAVVLVDSDRGLAARVDGIRGADRTVEASLFPGMALQVAVRWPEGAGDRRVFASWGSQAAAYGAMRPDGTWTIPCLPAGKYFVGASCTVPGREDPGNSFVEAEAGGKASITVR